MNDEIIKKIAKDYKSMLALNVIIRSKLKKMKSGKATYLDADAFALESAKMLGKALDMNLGGGNITGDEYKAIIGEILPKGTYAMYADVAGYALEVQKGVNAEQKIGLNPVKAKFNQKEVDAIVGIAKGADTYDEISGQTKQKLMHMSQNVATDTMKDNVAALQGVGMEATVTRVYDGVGVHTQNGGKYRKECEWCKSRCGTDVPYSKAIAMDMFRRHPGCGCIISYTKNGKTQVQSDWTKNKWEESDSHRQKALNKRAIQERGDYLAIKTGVALANMNTDGIIIKEKDLDNQPTNTLRKSIRKIKNNKKEHEDKIRNPQNYVEKWDERDPRYREGLIKYWKKEIEEKDRAIKRREDIIKKRGE